MDCLSVFNPSRHLISSFIIIYIFFSLMLSLLFFFLFSLLFFFFCFPFFFTPSPLFFRYGYKRGYGCFNLLLYPLAHTSLGILRTADFIKMTWALRRTWILWVTSRELSFNGLWNGGTSQAWFIVAAYTTPLVVSRGNLESVKELLVVKMPSIPRCLLTGS